MKQLGQSAVGTGTGTTLYTAPTGFRAVVKDMLIANTTAGAIALSLHIVPSGGSAADGNAIYGGVSIPANSTTHWSGVQAIKSGGFIQAISGSSGITVTITGEEVRDGT